MIIAIDSETLLAGVKDGKEVTVCLEEAVEAAKKKVAAEVFGGLYFELEHHIDESDVPEEYDSEITSEILCLRLVGEKERADEYLERYEQAKVERPMPPYEA